MTTTPPEAPPGGPGDPTGPEGPDGPRRTSEELRDLGRLRRSVEDRKIAGVAGGLARHLDVDPVLIRVALVVLVFFGGAGLLIYGACWLFVPEDGAREAPLGLDDRSRTVALVIAGVLAALALVGDSWGLFGFPWPVAVVAAVALILLTRGRRHAPLDDPGPAGGPPAGAAYGDTAPYGAAQYGAAQYGAAPYGTASYAAAPYGAAASYRPPRRRGPILFGFTLALVALGVGVLATVDLAGADVPAAGYPAVALTVIGAMLVLGAFWGRAGGLVLLGLVGLVGLGGASIADHWDGERIDVRPTSAAALASDHRMDAGELVIDLTGIDDLDNLDGRTLSLAVDIGRIEVIVPAGLDVRAEGIVEGFGHLQLFETDQGGVELDRTVAHDGGVGAPDLDIDARVGVGEIVIVTEQWRNR